MSSNKSGKVNKSEKNLGERGSWPHEKREYKKEFKTVSGDEVKRLYTPKEVKDEDYHEKLGFPGEPPFTRGIYPTMYRGRLWTMRQFSGFGTVEETNKRWKYLLEEGKLASQQLLTSRP